MPSPPRTVFDGLEGAWDEVTKQWRTANAQRERAEALKAQADREMVQAAARGVTRAVDDVKAGFAKAGARVRGSRAGAVVDALFGERRDPDPENGPVDRRTVNERVRDVRRPLEAARLSGSPVAKAVVWPVVAAGWLDRVQPKGRWDDKHQHPGTGRLYERQGNFSYGATAAALGLPEEAALRGAGLVQRLQAVGDALNRAPTIRERQGWLRPPYGDDARDQGAISEGYAYGRRPIHR